MFARKVSMQLKPNSAIEFSRVFERDVLPVLRQQKGFRDELTFVSGERSEAVAISLWDTRASADAFEEAAYAGLVLSLGSVIHGEPIVSTMAVSNSTAHGLASR